MKHTITARSLQQSVNETSAKLAATKDAQRWGRWTGRRLRVPKAGIESIRAAQKSNEDFILRKIREDGSYNILIGTVPLYNALDRLVESKRIQYSSRAHGYVLRGVKRLPHYRYPAIK